MFCFADEWIFPDKESSQLKSSDQSQMHCETPCSVLTSTLSDDKPCENKQTAEDQQEDIFTYSSKPRSAPHGKPLNPSPEICNISMDLKEEINGVCRGAQMEDDFYGNESSEEVSCLNRSSSVFSFTSNGTTTTPSHEGMCLWDWGSFLA